MNYTPICTMVEYRTCLSVLSVLKLLKYSRNKRKQSRRCARRRTEYISLCFIRPDTRDPVTIELNLFDNVRAASVSSQL